MAKRIHVALNFPRNEIDVPAYARHIAACMTGNPYFPSPPVSMATLLAHVEDLEAAEVTVTAGTHGAVTERNARVEDIHNDMRQLGTYVQTVANQHAEDAEAVVACSGMTVKQTAGPVKADFTVKPGKTSGSVMLYVLHPGTEASFNWQYSSDGVRWIDEKSTTQSSRPIDNLTPGVLYFFRYSILTRDGTSDWSDPITLRVV